MLHEIFQKKSSLEARNFFEKVEKLFFSILNIFRNIKFKKVVTFEWKAKNVESKLLKFSPYFQISYRLLANPESLNKTGSCFFLNFLNKKKYKHK